MMEPGTKVKIINVSGLFPERLMNCTGVVVIEHVHDNRSLIRMPDEETVWIYNFRLEEVK